ncbi:hypothetical protein [Marinimicrobium sp. LS-A18]|uniref:HzsA-related protein n=1 Tax=Marinimicrobium sp. LS-A18 TaxID=1381596 RepID=UPI0004678D57|nr:hypothetical protein [Marinimicrobium sp. LS-A18]
MTLRAITRSTLLPLLALGLTACGGGVGDPVGPGEDSGGGQTPDPVVVDFPIVYVLRPVPRDEDSEEILAEVLTEPARFNAGARLYFQDRATATAGRRELTAGLFDEEALYDVKDIAPHPDGDRFLFALRAPEIEDADDDEQPTWNIWEYDLNTESLRRVISSDLSAEAGQDVSPQYLPDDRILFSSTRQSRSRAVLLDDGKPQFAAQTENDNQDALVLHVMDADGRNIDQISYNQSHDLQPLIDADGRVLFTRWDGFAQNRLSFYQLNPDGTGLAPRYGYHSLAGSEAPALFSTQLTLGGQLLAIAKPQDELLGGDLVRVDVANHVENDQTLDGVEGGPAQRSLADRPIPLNGDISRAGLYHAAYPMQDGSERLLVSWSPCRVSVPEPEQEDGVRIRPCTDEWLNIEGSEPAPPLFGLWVFDPEGPTQQPVVLPEEDQMVTDPIALEPRPRPGFQEPLVGESNWVSEGVGVLHIQSVYDLDGEASVDIDALMDPAQTTAEERPARFLRLLKAVSSPDNDTLNDQDGEVFGNRFNQNRGLLEILGYVPIEPDGSVMTKVPADIAFSFDIVDAEGTRIMPPHRNWLQLRPGEQRNCQGCHSADSEVPHGHPERGPLPAYTGADTEGLPFPNTRRTDRFDTPVFPELEQTMAEFDAAIAFTCSNPDDPATCSPRGPRNPDVNIRYTDIWTDPAVREPDPDHQRLYSALAADDYREYANGENPDEGLTVSATYPPTSEGCQTQWTALCRVVINYENHIQNLWERQRLLTEENDEGQATLVLDEFYEPVDHTCVGCHTRFDADDAPRVPAGQLELTRNAAGNGQMTSYLELLNGDDEVTLVDGAVVDLLVETGEFETDEEGELVLDDDGNPIPIMTTVPVQAPLSRGGAAASAAFFARFEQTNDLTDPDAVDHRGMLNPNELRLLREWLDTGARYYNNPFDRARQDDE